MVSTLGLSIGMRAGLGIMAQFLEFTPSVHLTLASTTSVTLFRIAVTKPRKCVFPPQWLLCSGADVFVERSFSFYGPVISNGADAQQIPHCETRD